MPSVALRQMLAGSYFGKSGLINITDSELHSLPLLCSLKWGAAASARRPQRSKCQARGISALRCKRNATLIVAARMSEGKKIRH